MITTLGRNGVASAVGVKAGVWVAAGAGVRVAEGLAGGVAVFARVPVAAPVAAENTVAVAAPGVAAVPGAAHPTSQMIRRERAAHRRITVHLKPSQKCQ
jgi:hypothetical protein